MKRLLAPFLVALATPLCAQQAPGLDLQPTRTLAFTAHEATWMQLDLSPDGKTILFDLLGDIYALDAAGGTARPLLTGLAFEHNPVFSPDGKQFAFISDRSGVTNLWVANADGTSLRQISHDSSLVVYTSPAWSPDGKSLYVSRMVHSVLAFELVRFTADGSGQETIVKAQPNGNDGWDERVNAMGAVISPDGRYAYYATKLGHTWTEGDPPNWSIARRDLKNGGDEAILKPEGGAIRPVLSHDGRWLAYGSRRDGKTGLRLRDLETGADRWLAWPVDQDGEEGGYYYDLLPRFVFTPDDKAILMGKDGGIRRLDLASGAITPVPFSADVKLAMGPNTRVQQREETGPVRVRVIQAPRLSPDGKRLAYTALGALYIQDLRGGKPRAIVPADAFQPSWSPDGRTIAYVSWTVRDGGQVWTVPAAGGTPHRVTEVPAFYTEPLFAPDGKSLYALQASAYDRAHAETEISPDRPTDLIRLPLAGGAPSKIVHVFGARSLQQTTDGRLWFYAAGELKSVAPEGGAVRDEAAVVARAMGQYIGVPLPVQDLRVSPDGKRLLARAASQLYLLDKPEPKDGKIQPLNLMDAPLAARRITRDGADFAAWAPDGSLTWSVGSSFRETIMPAEATTAVEASVKTVAMPVSVPRDVPHGVIVLRGATVLPMQGDVIEHADIVVSDNRIAAVGPQGTVAIPRGATIRDLTGRFIIPGLVDTHAHYFGVRRGLHDREQYEFAADLAFGTTSALEVQPFTTDIFAYADMIDAGMMPGPRAWSTGPGVFVDSNISSLDAARDVLRRYRDHYRTRNIKSYMVGDRAAREYMVEASAELGMMPTTEGASDLVLNLTHAIDGFAGNEHTLPVTIREDVVKLFAESRTSYNPTLSVLYGGGPALFDYIITQRPQDDPHWTHFTPPWVVSEKLRNRHWMPKESQSYARFAADALRIQRAGGLVGMGSHGEMHGIGMHWEMQAFASGGATPMEVLRAATIDGATIIGHADDVGSIVPGKFADLVILDADPRLDIRNTLSIAWVMKNGWLYDPQTLDTVWPETTHRPAPWFASQ
ncbi:MAG: PD40 domain-containing protein [Novosphingobium sp.]|nr:PD40 domain-containing protein [Novosphingobium sp.]